MEVLVVVAIMGILFTIGPGLFMQTHKFFVLNRTRIELQREARTALSLINRNLRQAQISTITIDQVSGQPYYSRIEFTKIDGGWQQYYQKGMYLYMVTNSTKTLTENLRYLAFAPMHSDELNIISVSLTLEEKIYDNRTKALHMASEKVMVMNE